MATITILLQEGFIGEPARVWLDGREVLSKEHVKTRLQISAAEAMDIPVEIGSHVIRVELPRRMWKGELTTSVERWTTVRVNASGNTPTIEAVEGVIGLA